MWRWLEFSATKLNQNSELTCFSTYSLPWLAMAAPYPTATLAIGPCRNSFPANCPNPPCIPGIPCCWSTLVSSNRGVGPLCPPNGPPRCWAEVENIYTMNWRGYIATICTSDLLARTKFAKQTSLLMPTWWNIPFLDRHSLVIHIGVVWRRQGQNKVGINNTERGLNKFPFSWVNFYVGFFLSENSDVNWSKQHLL